MRLLYLVSSRKDIGTYHRAYRLALHLSGLGNDVHLICCSAKTSDRRISVENVNRHFRIHQQPVLGGSLYISVGAGYYFTQLLQSVMNSLKVSISEYDILHSFQACKPSIAIPTMVSKMLKRKPIFIDRDDAWKGGLLNNSNFLARPIFSAFDDYIPVNYASRITVISRSLYDMTLGLGINPNKVYLLPNGAEIDEVRPVEKRRSRELVGLDSGSKILMSLGHYYSPQLYLIMFKAVSMVAEELPSLKLIILGEPRLPAEAIPYYCGLSHCVKFIGRQPYGQLQYYLGAADAFILPMLDTIIDRARLPGRLSEYLAAGRPVVSNAVGDLKRILEEHECGLTSDPGNVDAFAENIVRILRDEELQVRLGNNARKTAEKYSWNRIAKDLDRLYRTVLT